MCSKELRKRTYVDQASNMSLHRCAAEEQIHLVVAIACVAYQQSILNSPENKEKRKESMQLSQKEHAVEYNPLPNRFKYSITLNVVSRYATVASR